MDFILDLFRNLLRNFGPFATVSKEVYLTRESDQQVSVTNNFLYCVEVVAETQRLRRPHSNLRQEKRAVLYINRFCHASKRII